MSSTAFQRPGIQAYLHEPVAAPRATLGLTHGAGGNYNAPLLSAVAEAFAEAGFLVLRYNLPYRQLRPTGPPANSAKKDQEGIRLIAATLRELAPDVPLVLSGHSYGGRMTTLAASAGPALAQALLLLSYPLHPPKQPAKARTEHFSSIRIPSVFFHGTRDPFGSPAELQAAIAQIPAPTRLITVEGAAHGLPPSAARGMPSIVSDML